MASCPGSVLTFGIVSKYNIVVFGEVLYDCFPDGTKVPGGAPFNVTWNLKALGENPLFVSSVGKDEMGKRLKTLAEKWGLSVEGIQEDVKVPTSTVQVALEDGIPSYTIVQDTAMDHIVVPFALESDRDSILYYGSLAARSDKTLSALSKIRQEWKGKVFLDINIRKPHFDANRFLPMLKGVDYLKINDEELSELTKREFVFANSGELLRDFALEHDLSNIILTCGKKGAFWYQKSGELLLQPASEGVIVVDTVGAGDAFASVCLLGICKEWQIDTVLEKASKFAGKVCGIQGATTKDETFYRIGS